MREYTVQYLNAKGKVKLYSFEAENIEEAVSIAQSDVDEYPNVEIYDDTDAEVLYRGVLVFKNGEQKTVHRIEDVMLTKHNNGSDKLHHTHLFEDNEEMEIVIPYENGIVLRFENHKFNDTVRCTPLLTDEREPTAIELATAIRELADWLRENHYDKIF